MKIKLVFIPLIFLSLASSIFFGGKWLLSWVRYLRLSHKTEATIEKWYIVKKGENHYYLKADFSYPIENKTFKSSWIFSQRFLNLDAAKNYIKKEAPKRCPVWYGASTCGLEKHLSYNDLIRFFLSSLIFIYFLLKNNLTYKKLS